MTAALATWLIEGLVALCAAAMLTRAFRFNASTQYVTWWIALVAVGAFTWTLAPAGIEPCSIPAGDCGAAVQASAAASEPLLYIASASGFWLSVFIGVWLSVALVRLIRLMPSLHAVYALRDRCREFPPAIEAQLPMWLALRERGRHVNLALSDAVPGATVLGFQRPCIAVPPHLVAALTPTELDHVILHEYAHVQRRDDWTRLAQALVQSVLWVHPAAAVIGRALDRAREMACDEWVVGYSGQPKAYARCLAHAAEAVSRARERGATNVAHYDLALDELTPALFGRAQDLVRRVDHLLGLRPGSRHTVSAISAVAVAIASGTAIAGVRAANLVAEIGEVAAPLVTARASSALRPVAALVVSEPIDAQPIDRRVRPRIARATMPPETYGSAETAPQIASASVLREPVEEVELLDARPIAGSYTTETAVHPPARPGTWTRVGWTAAQIGVSAGRAGTNLGTMFGRAGTSLARRF